MAVEPEYNPFPCGGEGEPSCPPEPADKTVDPKADPDFPCYSYNDMLKHGAVNYEKGKADQDARNAQTGQNA